MTIGFGILSLGAGSGIYLDAAGNINVSVAGSLTIGSNQVQLKGDNETPGPVMYYGTSPAGTKGWFSLTGEGVNTVNGLTGAIALTGAPAPGGYVGVTISGQTIYVSGIAGPNGALVLATHTTSGGGIGLGPDTCIFRLAAGQINVGSPGTPLNLASDAGGSYVRTLDTRALNLGAEGTTVLQLAGMAGNRLAVFTSGVQLGITGDYTTNRAASIAQLYALSGAAFNGGGAGSVVYTTGAQVITGLKTFNSGIFFGKVGIGILTPTYALDISTPTSTVLNLDGASAGYVIRFSDGTKGYIGPGNSAINGLPVNSLGISAGNNAALAFGTNGGTEVMRLTGKNVGIGITTPGYLLHTSGTQNAEVIRFTNTNAANTNSLGIGGYTPNSAGINLYLDGTAQVSLSRGGGMLIGPGYAGNLSPSNGLAVQGSGAFGSLTTSGRLHLQVVASDDGLKLYRDATLSELARLCMDGANDRGRLILYNAGTARTNLIANADSYINSTAGNLGIATTTPVSTLDVSGVVRAKTYVVPPSGIATPVTGASSGRLNIDMGAAGLQFAIITGGTIISGLNYTAGGATTLRLFAQSGAGATNFSQLAFPTGWRFVSLMPTGLYTGKLAVLTIQCYVPVDSGIVAAYAIEA